MVPPGELQIDGDGLVAGGREILITIANPTGAPGTVSVSEPIGYLLPSLQNAVCPIGGAVCDVNPDGLSGVNVFVDLGFASPNPVTVVLRDANGDVVASYTSPA